MPPQETKKAFKRVQIAIFRSTLTGVEQAKAQLLSLGMTAQEIADAELQIKLTGTADFTQIYNQLIALGKIFK